MFRTPATENRPSHSGLRRGAVLLALLTLTASAVAGCTSAQAPEASPQALAAGLHPLGDGFLGDNATPAPEATLSPQLGSWDGVEPPAGYRVVLVSAGTDAATTTLVASVVGWAKSEKVDLTTLSGESEDAVIQNATDAIDAKPDLIVAAGEGVIDMFMLITSQSLHQQFLIIGAELPEPTHNVTSVIWDGATFRGTGLGSSGDLDPASVTSERGDAAITAGVASVLHGITGIVIELPK